jgi:fibronectin type 3 domain-containing protein
MFASNASNSQSGESVTGSGTAVQHSVDLSWVDSASSVAGYNVYRGTTVGAYSKINSGLDPATVYTDNTIASGSTYYYAATAVNSSGQESGYSTPIKVAVP